MQCISLLCWVFLFYIPILNQAQNSISADQRVALCTQLGVKIVQLGGSASHTSVDCPCSGQSIAHHFNIDHLTNALPQHTSVIYNSIIVASSFLNQHRTRAPPLTT
jgi:hypothetical protein